MLLTLLYIIYENYSHHKENISFIFNFVSIWDDKYLLK